jgi:hypothetical protein
VLLVLDQDERRKHKTAQPFTDHAMILVKLEVDLRTTPSAGTGCQVRSKADEPSGAPFSCDTAISVREWSATRKLLDYALFITIPGPKSSEPSLWLSPQFLPEEVL